MSKAKLFIFAPREEPKGVLDTLTNAGLELMIGDPKWQLPHTDHEGDLINGADRKSTRLNSSH